MTTSAALALSEPLPPRMTVASDLLGPLDVSLDDVFTFPAGLLGFPECQRFVLVHTTRDGVFWLQSADHGALAFLLVDPFRHFPEYAVELSAADLAALSATDASDMAVLTIVTLPSSRALPATANLQGPLVINMRARCGRQAVLPNIPFGTQEPVNLS
jgi:flagellar assembly factor FliW